MDLEKAYRTMNAIVQQGVQKASGEIIKIPQPCNTLEIPDFQDEYEPILVKVPGDTNTLVDVAYEYAGQGKVSVLYEYKGLDPMLARTNLAFSLGDRELKANITYVTSSVSILLDRNGAPVDPRMAKVVTVLPGNEAWDEIFFVGLLPADVAIIGGGVASYMIQEDFKNIEWWEFPYRIMVFVLDDPKLTGPTVIPLPRKGLLTEEEQEEDYSEEEDEEEDGH